MNSKFSLTIIIILILFNGLLLFSLNNNINGKSDNRSSPETNNGNQEYSVVKQLLAHVHFDNFEIQDVPLKRIDYKIFFTDTKPEELTLNLSEVLQGEKIVLYYSLTACNSCISEQFVLLDKLRKKIDKGQIVVLAEYINNSDLLYLVSGRKLPFFKSQPVF